MEIPTARKRGVEVSAGHTLQTVNDGVRVDAVGLEIFDELVSGNVDVGNRRAFRGRGNELLKLVRRAIAKRGRLRLLGDFLQDGTPAIDAFCIAGSVARSGNVRQASPGPGQAERRESGLRNRVADGCGLLG
ncbi:hypothetical protein [Bradyrhizobium tunisiense]|uniref:hypothetical protein n=1 Tax=Bradyrhizobium tunisiense TaxID=3278709 RepID=UPI0035DC0FA8